MAPASSISHRSEEEDEDLISKLPSDVVVSILEKLELGDLVRVSVLSRRWRNLPHQLPRLALDVNDFLPDEEDRFYEDNGDDELELPADLPPDTLAQASEAMLQAMVALLMARRRAAAAGGGAEESCSTALAVSFLLRSKYLSIGRVLDDAMASGKARAIELTFSTTYDINSYSDDMGHTINVLAAYGRRFRKLFDACPAAFGGLTRLTMKNMEIRSCDFHDILATCTRLQMLSLDTCDAGPRVSWRVEHARLAELTIGDCTFGGIDLAWLPRLQRFTYRSWWVCPTRPLLSFAHVPRLTTVTLSAQEIGQPALRLSHILVNTAVTDLRLNFKGQDIWVKPEGPKRLGNMFCNLKHIKIRNLHEECGLSWINFLLQASPCPQELHIKLWDHECAEDNQDVYATKRRNVQWEEVAAGFKHYGLTRVTILGLYNNTGEKVVAYIRHLVEAAVNLEEIQILRNTFCKECGGTGSGFPRTDQERDSLRQRISGGETVAFKICIQS